jgi:hypothetical protein
MWSQSQISQANTAYSAKLSEMSDAELAQECYNMIYQSALWSSDPKAPWHEKAEVCRKESVKRDPNASIYTKALAQCCKENDC